MKTDKQRKVKGEQVSLRHNISKSLPGGKRSLKSSGGWGRQKTDKHKGPGTSSCVSSDIKLEVGRKLQPSAKIKLQLFPLNDAIRKGLEKDGHNPFLELTLKARKKITSVLEHLCKKWGSSNIALGELMLFPFDTMIDNLIMHKRWSSGDASITAGDVHAAIESPVNFRLRYGWVSTQTSNSMSSPSLGYPEPGHLETVSSSIMETTCGAEIQSDLKRRELQSSNTNELENMTVEQTISAEPYLVVQTEEFKPRKTSKMENCSTPQEKASTEPLKYEDSRMQTDTNFTSLLWSDLSNISIGGLLSEVSFQGRFNTQDIKLGGGRFASPLPAVAFDSLDAVIDQLKCSHASHSLSADKPSSILDAEIARAPDMSSSILDADNTCHSFAFSKPSSSSKDFPVMGRNAFSELSNQAIASRPLTCPKSEANAQVDVVRSHAAQESKADPLPCSVGEYNNENSMGLSSLRWDESLGPFDLFLTSRQIIKDDSISIGGFVR